MLALAGGLLASPAAGQAPRDVTARTLADPRALAVLQTSGTVLFEDGFEERDLKRRYFEVSGLDDGRVRIDGARGAARTGRGAVRCAAPARGGGESSSWLCLWLGAEGYERLHFRRWVRFPEGYDQGDLHHVGGWLEATSGTGKWDHMGTAGTKPNGDDWFNASFEPWRAWGRYDPPGYMFLYVYWPEMKRDDLMGKYYGNNLAPPEDRRIAIERGRWYCLEHMILANTPGTPDGELAAWIDGELYLHFTGLRWRDASAVRLKRVSFGLYVHRADRDNRVWYDDVAVSTGYVGCGSSAG